MSYAPTQPGTDVGSIGVANGQALTLFDSEPYLPDYISTSVSNSDADTAPPAMAQGNPALVLVGLVGALVVLGFIRSESEHVASGGIAFNAFNFLTIILITMVGFVIAKVIFSHLKVPGLSQIVHAA